MAVVSWLVVEPSGQPTGAFLWSVDTDTGLVTEDQVALGGGVHPIDLHNLTGGNWVGAAGSNMMLWGSDGGVLQAMDIQTALGMASAPVCASITQDGSYILTADTAGTYYKADRVGNIIWTFNISPSATSNAPTMIREANAGFLGPVFLVSNQAISNINAGGFGTCWGMWVEQVAGEAPVNVWNYIQGSSLTAWDMAGGGSFFFGVSHGFSGAKVLAWDQSGNLTGSVSSSALVLTNRVLMLDGDTVVVQANGGIYKVVISTQTVTLLAAPADRSFLAQTLIMGTAAPPPVPVGLPELHAAYPHLRTAGAPVDAFKALN